MMHDESTALQHQDKACLVLTFDLFALCMHNCSHLYTFTSQCIQIGRQNCHKSLSLSCPHLCNLSVVQNHATNELHIKWPQTQDTF